METGCTFDNHRGIYMGEAIIKLAESYGMPYDESDRTPEDEFYFEHVEEAENWLNKNVAEERFMFGYGIGAPDFMYMPISWWEEM